MKIFDWIKNRKEVKLQKQEAFYDRIKYLAKNNIETELTGKVDFTNIVDELVKYKKDRFSLDYSSTNTLNRQIKDLVINMCMDYKLKEEIYTHVFINSKGNEENFLSLICDNAEVLDEDTLKYITCMFPLELFNQPLQKMEDLKITIAGCLLIINSNDFILELLKQDKELFFSNKKTKIQGLLTESFISVLHNEFSRTKNTKYTKNKFDYIMMNLKSEHFIGQNSERIMLMYITALKKEEYLPILLENDVLKISDFPFVISVLLENFEKEKKEKKQKLIINIINELVKKEPSILSNTKYVLGASNITEKTYSMWCDNFLKSEFNPETMNGLLNNILIHSEKPDFELFKKYCEKANFESVEKKKENIALIYQNLEKNKQKKENLINYIDFYITEQIGEINSQKGVWLKNMIKNQKEISEKEIGILKQLGVNPFYRFNDEETIFDVTNKDVQGVITQIFFEEKANAEKEIIMQSIGLSQEKNAIIKKRL